MKRLVWSLSALADFEQAIAYIADQDPHAARLVAERIDAAIRSLGRHPTGRPGRVSGTYEKSVAGTPYIVAYSNADTAITVLRVIHASRDWPKEKWPS
ncbi:type II toxin-antitoxin system RelE/ParE family toxin [Neoaquamicrobium sediminum]|uniref:type II toxin-antitoxin system RelE/ParE family toxin n=1 Tax=Neoaquamicrobium sediminum TaxID=1849104 RepID=UPI003BA87FE5